MSGHSKWSQIKRKKEAADLKRGQEFTRLSSQIKQAARVGPDSSANPALAEVLARAKRANMPQTNIDRLLAQTTSTTNRTITYEAFGPGGSALIITATTDNPRRTVAELRTILKQHNASLGEPGSVAWKFKRSSSQQYTPLYPQTLSPAHQTQLSALAQELKDHPDVEWVFLDAVK